MIVYQENIVNNTHEKLEPNYYSILPATVRYNENLKPNEKLLYSEITALTNKTGICFATNEHFANLYKVSKTAISGWINTLKKQNLISSQLIYAEGTKQILSRYIKIVYDPIKENLHTPIKENFKDNNTRDEYYKNNNIYIGVVDYLNEKAGTRFKPVESNLKFIRGRLTNGYTEQDLKAVIDLKVAEWKGTDMQKYLRPETLFNATKFESYLNGLKSSKGIKQDFHQKEYTKEELDAIVDNLDDVLDYVKEV